MICDSYWNFLRHKHANVPLINARMTSNGHSLVQRKNKTCSDRFQNDLTGLYIYHVNVAVM